MTDINPDYVESCANDWYDKNPLMSEPWETTSKEKFKEMYRVRCRVILKEFFKHPELSGASMEKCAEALHQYLVSELTPYQTLPEGATHFYIQKSIQVIQTYLNEMEKP